MGFFKDVAELRARMKKHLAEGAGTQSLIKAIGDGPLGADQGSAPPPASPSPSSSTPVLKPDLPTSQELSQMIDNLPDRISTDQLKELLAKGVPIRGKKK